MRQPSYVYIMSNRKNGTTYIGITSDIVKHVYEHKHGVARGFTHKYNLHTLVHYEVFDGIEYAIAREKQLKAWKKTWKVELIEKQNPEWKDLYPYILGLADGDPDFRQDDVIVDV